MSRPSLYGFFWPFFVIVMGLGLNAGCGWHLRGVGAHAIDLPPLHVNGKDQEFVNTLSQALQELGVKIQDDSATAWRLRVIKHQYTRRPGAISRTGQAESYLLGLSLQFEFTRPGGADHFEPYTVNANRDLQYDQSSVLGKDAEELGLRRSLVTDIAQQVTQRLRAASKP